jgi:hypothetical protein
MYQKKYPSTDIPCTAVRVLGLNKLFLKGFLRSGKQPVQLISPAARVARAKKFTSPPTILKFLGGIIENPEPHNR